MLELACALAGGTAPGDAVELTDGKYVWLPYTTVTKENLEAFLPPASCPNGDEDKRRRTVWKRCGTRVHSRAEALSAGTINFLDDINELVNKGILWYTDAN